MDCTLDRAAGAGVSHQTMAGKASDFHLDGTLPPRPSLRTNKAVSLSPPRTNKNGSPSPTGTNKALPLNTINNNDNETELGGAETTTTTCFNSFITELPTAVTPLFTTNFIS